MAENTVTDRNELIEALRGLYLNINQIVGAQGVLRAVYTIPDDDVVPFGKVCNKELALELAMNTLEEKLDGIYDIFGRVEDAAGIHGPLFGDLPS